MRKNWYFALLVLLAAGILLLLLFSEGGRESLRPLIDWFSSKGKELTDASKRWIPISEQEERVIGARVAQRINSELTMVKGKVERYIQEVGRSLSIYVNRLGIRPYEFYIYDSTDVNAYSVLGGHVYVTSPMLQLIESEAELAFILAHEIAHIDLEHCVDAVRFRYGLRKEGLKIIPELVQLGHEIFKAGFDIDQELEADRYAIDRILKCVYTPQAVLWLFERMADIEGSQRPSQGEKTHRKIWELLREGLKHYRKTHPPWQDRIKLIHRFIDENKDKIAGRKFYYGVQNFNLRETRFAKEIPGEWLEFKE
jgi:predicted Zn-dependent protease